MPVPAGRTADPAEKHAREVFATDDASGAGSGRRWEKPRTRPRLPRGGTGRTMSDKHDEKGGGGSADTRFLDLEISKVMYNEAEGVTRDAFRELLKDAAKDRFRQLYGKQIEELARLAVDELFTDLEANLEIEARIVERTEKQAELAERVRAALSGKKKKKK
jgi:hypothetical protein